MVTFTEENFNGKLYFLCGVFTLNLTRPIMVKWWKGTPFSCSLKYFRHQFSQIWSLLPEDFKQERSLNQFTTDSQKTICTGCPCMLCQIWDPRTKLFGTAIHHDIIVFSVMKSLFLIFLVSKCELISMK